MKKLLIMTLLLSLSLVASGQQYTGMNGLLHTPSADMDMAGDARLGVHFLNKTFTPSHFIYAGEKYHTASFYMSLTPYSWLELGYTFTLFKSTNSYFGREGTVGYHRKDRYISARLRLLPEGRWWPAVAVGANDPATTSKSGNQYFGNYFASMSKHIPVPGFNLGIHLSYRRFIREDNRDRWDGIVGGVTLQPRIAPNLRLVAEYDGDGFQLGADCVLMKHFLLQISTQEGGHLSGGVCYRINLL